MGAVQPGSNVAQAFLPVWILSSQVLKRCAGRRTAMTRKTRVWLLFLLVLFLLSLAGTSYSKTVDRVLIGLRLTVVAIISVLTVREWLLSQRTGPDSNTEDPTRPRNSLLRPLRRCDCLTD